MFVILNYMSILSEDGIVLNFAYFGLLCTVKHFFHYSLKDKLRYGILKKFTKTIFLFTCSTAFCCGNILRLYISVDLC